MEIKVFGRANCTFTENAVLFLTKIKLPFIYMAFQKNQQKNQFLPRGTSTFPQIQIKFKKKKIVLDSTELISKLDSISKEKCLKLQKKLNHTLQKKMDKKIDPDIILNFKDQQKAIRLVQQSKNFVQF